MFFSANYRPNKRLSPEAKEDLFALLDLIANGKRLPERYYRSAIEATPDELLEETGILHLHLVSKNSDELLYCAQYSDALLILACDTHRHFGTVPKGKLLRQQHAVQMRQAAETEGKTAKAEAEQRAKAEEARKAKIAESAAKLKPHNR